MIPVERFIVQSSNRAAWHKARRGAVTATEVAKAATQQGFQEVMKERNLPEEVFPDNDYMKFGRDNENWIALDAKHNYGLLPNEWLIQSDLDSRFMATPDGLTLDHKGIGEYKTGGTMPTSKRPGIQHYRQIQWQFVCTGAEWARYAFVQRIEVNGKFMPASFDPTYWEVEPDQEVMEHLIATAYEILKEAEKWR